MSITPTASRATKEVALTRMDEDHQVLQEKTHWNREYLNLRRISNTSDVTLVTFAWSFVSTVKRLERIFGSTAKTLERIFVYCSAR